MPATQVPKSKDFMEWYNEIVEVAELTDKRYPIKGMNIWRPYGQRIMSAIDAYTRAEMARTHHDEVSFPLLIPEKLFMKEADQIKGFGSEVFWVTHAGDNKLPDGERWIVRPTSECAMYEIFPLWIRSHSDLPLTTYQICNVFRYETKQTRAFMRVREIHFFEDHSVFADEASARAHVELDLQIVRNVYQKLALPALYSKRPDWDKFPGAVDSTGADVVMPSGRTLQCATVHYYGENFARAYGMHYEGWWENRLRELNPGRKIEVRFPPISWSKGPGQDGRTFLLNVTTLTVDGTDVSLFDVQEGTATAADLPGDRPNPIQILRPGHLARRGLQAGDLPNADVAFQGLLVVPPFGTHGYCHQTTYGMSERLVGAIVGCHGDDNGLILPPDIAPIQVVVVPVLFKGDAAPVLKACRDAAALLRAAGIRVEVDERDRSPGEKYYHWELRGVPLRLEIGPKDVEKQSAFAARRDMGKEGKRPIPMAQLEDGVRALLADIQKALHERQAAFIATRVQHPKSLDEAKRLDAEGLASGVGYVLAMPICGTGCAAQVEKGLDIKTLGVPVDKEYPPGPCAVCGTQAKDTLRFARTY